MRRQQTVWVCRQSGAVFLEREKFQKYLLSKRKLQAYARRKSKIIADADAFTAGCETIEELENWLNTSSYFLDLANLDYQNATSTLGNFKFTDLNAGNCSNSHSAPRGLSTNWGNQYPDLPRNYPGIHCTIKFSGEIKTKAVFSDRAYDLLDNIGISPGTGGSADGKTFKYDCIIWAQHFPKLYRNLIVKRIATQLGFDSTKIVVSKYENR